MHQKGSASVTCDICRSRERRAWLLGPDNALLQEEVVSCDPIIVHTTAPLPESAGNKMPFNAYAMNSNFLSPLCLLDQMQAASASLWKEIFSILLLILHSPPGCWTLAAKFSSKPLGTFILPPWSRWALWAPPQMPLRTVDRWWAAGMQVPSSCTYLVQQVQWYWCLLLFYIFLLGLVMSFSWNLLGVKGR